MDTRQLEYVLTLAEERSLFRAAERLFVSPSALSQSIAKLEQSLRTKLFTRGKNGWNPTPAGNIYLDMAKEVIDLRRKAYTEIRMSANQVSSTLTVGITPGRGTIMFAQIFPVFNAKYPNIKISLVEDSVRAIVDQIVQGKVDLGFLTSGFDDSAVAVRHMVTERFLIVIPRSHPMAGLADSYPYGDYATVSLSQFKDDEFMLMGHGSTLRTIEDKMFADAGFTPKVSFETSSMQTINSLSRQGFGISFVPQFYATYTDQAVYFKLDPPVSWDLLAVYRPKARLTTPEEFLISIARDYYKTTPYTPE